MTTSEVDVSFMNSYFKNDISKDEMLSNFNIEQLSTYDEPDTNNYKNFVQNLGKLTWVINKYYDEANENNKKTILELINMYLVQYFNHFNNLVQKYVLENKEETEHVVAEKNKLLDIVGIIGKFVVRLHYKIKYFDLRNMPSNELHAYILMEENIQTDTRLQEEYQKNLEAMAPPSEGNLDDILEITRGTIHSIITSLRSGNTDTAHSLLMDVLDTNTILKKTLKESETVSVLEKPVDMKVNIDKPKKVEPKKVEVDKETINSYVNQLNTKVQNSNLPTDNINLDFDMDDMDDIGIEIISEEEAKELIHNDLKETLENQMQSTVNQTVLTDDTDKEVLDVEDITENHMDIDMIVNDHFSSAWDIDVEHLMSKVSRYVAETSYNETSEDLKKIKKHETRYILYILAFLRSEHYI